MKIFVTAKPGAHKEEIKKIDTTHFIISVKEPPVRGEANKAIIKVLSNYFKIPKSSIFLKTGFSSKQKVFEILESKLF